MAVSVKIIKEQDLTVFFVVGELKHVEQMEAIKSFYEGEPTSKTIWDFSACQGSRGNQNDIQKILSYAISMKDRRLPGKTAILAPADVDFGLARMTGALSEIAESPWEVRAFRTLEEAVEWLQVDYTG